MIVAGVSIKSGRTHVAVVESPSSSGPLTFSTPMSSRLGFNESLNDAAKFVDLSARIYEVLAAAHAAEVGLLQVRAFANWKYSDAYGRVLAAAATMSAANRLGIPFDTYKTEAVGRTVQHRPDALDALPYADFGLDRAPRYWTTGLCSASAVAAHVLGVSQHV